MWASKIWIQISEWRWSPAVALALGALLYVGVVILVVPDRIGSEGVQPTVGARSFAAVPTLANRPSSFAASISPSLAHESEPVATAQARMPVSPPAPQPDLQSFPRRGFTPPLDRPDPPPPPPPPAPPPVALPAAPTAAAPAQDPAAAAAAVAAAAAQIQLQPPPGAQAAPPAPPPPGMPAPGAPQAPPGAPPAPEAAPPNAAPPVPPPQ